MADNTNQVIPEDQPLPLDLPEENDTMAKMTVAQLHAKHEALDVQVDNLSSALSEALGLVESQGEMIAALELETNRAHDRLDKARKVIQGLSGNQTTQATKQARPAPKANDRKHSCTVPGNPHGDEQVTHSTNELNACWQNFYAAKA